MPIRSGIIIPEFEEVGFGYPQVPVRIAKRGPGADGYGELLRDRNQRVGGENAWWTTRTSCTRSSAGAC